MRAASRTSVLSKNRGISFLFEEKLRVCTNRARQPPACKAPTRDAVLRVDLGESPGPALAGPGVRAPVSVPRPAALLEWMLSRRLARLVSRAPFLASSEAGFPLSSRLRGRAAQVAQQSARCSLRR